MLYRILCLTLAYIPSSSLGIEAPQSKSIGNAAWPFVLSATNRLVSYKPKKVAGSTVCYHLGKLALDRNLTILSKEAHWAEFHNKLEDIQGESAVISCGHQMAEMARTGGLGKDLKFETPGTHTLHVITFRDPLYEFVSWFYFSRGKHLEFFSSDDESDTEQELQAHCRKEGHFQPNATEVRYMALYFVQEFTKLWVPYWMDSAISRGPVAEPGVFVIIFEEFELSLTLLGVKLGYEFETRKSRSCAHPSLESWPDELQAIARTVIDRAGLFTLYEEAKCHLRMNSLLHLNSSMRTYNLGM